MNDLTNDTTVAPEAMEREINQTRSAITQKLEALEEKVRGTVQTAKDSVEETITNVTSSVTDTVSSVKQTLDLKQHVVDHPWPMLGGSVVVGFLVGKLLEGQGGPRSANGCAAYAPLGKAPDRYERMTSQALDAPTPAGAAPKPGIMSQFDDEIRQVKELAIGYSLGLLRDSLRGSLNPQLQEHVDRIVDGVTTKLGGTPIRDTGVGRNG